VFERDRVLVEKALRARLARLPGVPPRLAAAMRYAALAPGKRLRPLLVLLGYDAVGGSRASRRHALAAACAVECVHAFSLVHDDLPALDDDALRRGRPTLHKKFDEATAILAGDALLALALQDVVTLAAQGVAPKRAALATFVLAEATGPRGMIGGQMLDLAAEGRWTARGPGRASGGRGRLGRFRRAVTLAAVRRIHRGKTGELLAASLVVGGAIGGGDARRLRLLRAVGLELGLAFQIADDLLNETGDAKTLGKHAGTDRARGKATWPALAGTVAAERTLARLTARAVARVQVFPNVSGRFATLAAFLAARRS
jgi:geranylgeranyl pyrophosphate synthase